MKGRKRHVAVDSLGIPLAIVVTGAQVQDNQFDGAGELLSRLRAGLDRRARHTGRWPRLWRVVGDDHIYRGQVSLWAELLGMALVNVTRPMNVRGFVHLPKRWVIERTFGWFQQHRRLTFDYEYKPANSEGMLWLATIGILLNRLFSPTTS